jgi:hypothetical protein
MFSSWGKLILFHLVGFIFFSLSGLPTSIQAATFQYYDPSHTSYGRDVSYDGSKISVWDYQSNGFYRWIPQSGITERFYTHSTGANDFPGISGNGNVMVGSFNYWAVYSKGGDTFTNLSPGNACDANYNGSVIVGTANGQAAKWTWNGSTYQLQYLSGGFEARALSSNGSVIAGRTSSATDSQAVVWNHGAKRELGANTYQAYGVSADGRAVVGQGRVSAYNAFLWTPIGGVVGLGNLGNSNCAALGVANDGKAVVGTAYDPVAKTWVAFIWFPDTGMLRLKDYLIQTYPELAEPLTGWTLTEARAITPDGTTIVGYGYNPKFINNQKAWVTTGLQPVPAPGKSLPLIPLLLLAD